MESIKLGTLIEFLYQKEWSSFPTPLLSPSLLSLPSLVVGGVICSGRFKLGLLDKYPRSPFIAQGGGGGEGRVRRRRRRCKA